jgi:branched-chain amino acid transport system substrate-binding protein
MRKTIVILVVLILAVTVTAGCSPSKTTASDKVLTIGGIFPLTGSSAVYGVNSKNAMTMAVNEFNAAGGATVDGARTTVRAVAEDDTGSPEVGASAAQKLINQDKAIGLIGAVMSKVSLAFAPIAQAAGVPQIATISTATGVTLVGDYIFRVCFIDPFQGRVMADFVWNNLKLKTAAVLFDNGNDYNKGLADVFKTRFEQLGGRVIAWEAFTDADKTVDYRPQLTNIKAANPEFLYLPNYFASVVTTLKQAHDLGMTIPAGGGDGWGSPELIRLGGADVEGCYFSDHVSLDDPRPEVQNFASSYKKLYGDPPDATAILTYDATNLFLQALRTAGTASGAKLRDTIRTITFKGVSGTTTFDADRNPIKSAVIIQVKDGAFKYVTTIQP